MYVNNKSWLCTTSTYNDIKVRVTTLSCLSVQTYNTRGCTADNGGGLQTIIMLDDRKRITPSHTQTKNDTHKNPVSVVEFCRPFIQPELISPREPTTPFVNTG